MIPRVQITKFRSTARAFLAVMFIVLCCGFAAVRAQAVVRTLPDALIDGDRVFLGAISSIEGEASVAERLARISLGYAPNVGMTRELRREQIVLAVRTAGFSDNDARVESPAIVLIRRPGQIVNESMIREAIEKEFFTKLKSENVEARLTRLGVPPNIQVPAGAMELRVNSSSVRNVFMPFSVAVEIRVNGSLVRTFVATCEIEAYADIFRAAKDLDAGVSVGEGDLRRENARIDRPVSNYVRDLSTLRGAALTRGVWNGAALTRDSIAAVAVIKSGDPIRIEAGSGRMKIVVNGEAKAAGRIGDRIAVKNSQTGAILQAFVVDKGIVKVGL